MDSLFDHLLNFKPQLFMVARLLVGFFFVFFGVWNTIHWHTTAILMQQKKIPLFIFGLFLGIALETICGIMIICNFYASIAALCLIPFVIVAVFIFHPFWSFEGDLRVLNMLCFITNLTSTLGALLLLLVMDSSSAVTIS
jgi:uncharacterized membrane protein YphA (DoxX/SURF4 family)